MVNASTDRQDSELHTIYAFAPPAPPEQVLDKARTAYLKATGAIPDEAPSEREICAEGGKRKEAVGEDCPVYVYLLLSSLPFHRLSDSGLTTG